MTNTQEATHPLDIELVSGMCDQARLAEQRRIVALLDRIIDERSPKAVDSVEVSNEVSNLRYLIELIQGKTKWFDHTS